MDRDQRFVVELQEDVASGELVLPVPQIILNEMGWYEGTELEWTVEGDELILREIEK
jgi:antitoxin component of MazEF toxin-antitoxin module